MFTSRKMYIIFFNNSSDKIQDLDTFTRRVYMCIFGFKGASTSKVIGARNEMMRDGYDGQMIFGDLVGLKLPDIRLTGEEKPRKKPHTGNLPRPGIEPGTAA